MNIVYQRLLALIVALMTLVLSGCASLSPAKTYSMHTYLLTANPIPSQTVSSSKAVLLVTPTFASAGFDTNALLYQKEAYQLESFSKNAWVSPPADMITPAISANLVRLGYFKAIINSNSSFKADYILNTRLLSLYQDFTTTPSLLLFSINVNLIASQTNTVLASHTFSYSIKTTADTPYGGVLAANKALSEFLQDLATWIFSQIQLNAMNSQ